MKSYSNDLPNFDKLKGKFRVAYMLIIINVVLTGFLVVDTIYQRYPEVVATFENAKTTTVDLLNKTIETEKSKEQ